MDLSDLKARVDQAVVERDAPPPPEGKPIQFPDQLIGNDGWEVTWTVVRALRAKHGDVFNLYPEATLALQILDVLEDAAEVPTLDGLADELRALADREGPWLVSTPLSGIELPVAEPAIKINDTTVLWRAALGDRQWQGVEQKHRDVDEASALVVFDMIGDHLERPSQYLSYWGDKEEIDTHRSATLVSVQHGSIGLALTRAQAQAQYAIAVWVLLEPPAAMRAVPDLGLWAPQPYLHLRARFKPLEQGQWPAKERTRGGSISDLRGYETPALNVLQMPFEALAVSERRCAQALLSASLALHDARRGTRHQLSERLRAVRAAIEVLCESKPGASDAEGRWQKLVARYGVEQELAVRGYEKGDADDISKRLRLARNVAAHGADAVLLDLGWPAGVDRVGLKGTIPAEDLGMSALHADLEMLATAVALVLRGMWADVGASGFDDTAFEALF